MAIGPQNFGALRARSLAAGVDPIGVGCAQLQSTDKEAIVNKIPGSVQDILETKGLDDEYKNLFNDLLVSTKGRVNNWQGSSLYRTMVLHDHVSIFARKNVSLFLTKEDSLSFAIYSIIKLCLVDRSQQATYVPADIYTDGAALEVGIGRQHVFPKGVVGVDFEGDLDGDVSSMPVSVMRLLQEHSLLLENMQMAAKINTAEKDSFYAARVAEQYQDVFRAKGVGLFFCGFNSKPVATLSWSSSGCPEGSAKITSEEECKGFAGVVATSYLGSESKSSSPSGCYRQSGKALYNQHPTGSKSQSASLICKRFLNIQQSNALGKGHYGQFGTPSFRYWFEYADLSVTGDAYTPKLGGEGELQIETAYPMARVHAFKQCMEGDSTAVAQAVFDIFNTGIFEGIRGDCLDVAGAVRRESKGYPNCKCQEDSKVYCGNKLVAERKFDISSVFSISGCAKKTAYCAKRPCMIPKGAAL
jgi:hypothetical protein